MERMSFMDCDVVGMTMEKTEIPYRPSEERADQKSLRDYFAGLALSNLCSHSIPKGQVEMMAAFAYDLAEAMMEERKRRNSG